jgi:hypothetical protein
VSIDILAVDQIPPLSLSPWWSGSRFVPPFQSIGQIARNSREHRCDNTDQQVEKVKSGSASREYSSQTMTPCNRLMKMDTKKVKKRSERETLGSILKNWLKLKVV